MTVQNGNPTLVERLISIRERAKEYFDEAASVIQSSPWGGLEDYWGELPEPLKQKGRARLSELATLVQTTASAIQQSPLLDEKDRQEVAFGPSLPGLGRVWRQLGV